MYIYIYNKNGEDFASIQSDWNRTNWRLRLSHLNSHKRGINFPSIEGTKKRNGAKSQQETFIFGEYDWRRGIYTRNDPRKSKTRRKERRIPLLNVFRERDDRIYPRL